MAPDLHLDPDRLHEHAATAAAVAADLAAVPGPPGDDREADRVRSAVGRAVGDLTELAAALTAVSAAARAADGSAARALVDPTAVRAVWWSR